MSQRFNGTDWPRPVLQKRDRRLAPFFSGREEGFVAEIQRRGLAASGFARARPATCSIFRRTDERICRGDLTAQTGRVRFYKSATGDLRHFRRAGGIICRGDSTVWTAASGFARAQPAACAIFQRTRGRICRGDSTAQTGRVRFCKSVTGNLRHFSADARDLSRRFNGVD